MMDSARWERIQTLFHDAAELPQDKQHAFLSAACGGDDELMARVLALLEEDARGSSLLDRDVAQVAHQMIGGATAPALDSKQFGPYRIQQVLGEGGMGVVYLAERQDLQSQVAIKILRDAWLSPSRRERFASEQRTLAQLNHPSIARLYDADTLNDGTPWFVMEYVEGLPLTEYCAQHECSVEERLQLFRAVCEAVQYAHQHAVIHRDLKPSNILVKPDGSVRLLDFGIAKQLESFDMAVDQTQTGLRLMTPAYAAPEQIRGERVGIHTDVYSLGVIFYELLAGRLPYDLSNCTPGDAVTFIVEHEPEKPSAAAQRVAGLPGARARVPAASKAAWGDLDVLCLTAMHKDPRRRYQTVDALMRDVDHFLKGEPLEARPDTLRYTLGKFAGRNRRAVTAAALVFAAVVSLVVFYTVRLARARNAALAETARTLRIQQFMQNLFQGGDQSAGPADNLRVVTLLDRGVLEARGLDADPAVQAELYETLGTIYQKLGKLEQADSLLTQALEKHKAVFGPDNSEVAKSLLSLGLLRSSQARLEEAEKLVRDGLEMTKRHSPPTHPAVAKATAALGKVLEERGQYDKSVQVLEQAVQLQTVPGPPTPDLAASLYELSNAHFYTGHLDISESLNQQALVMFRQLYGERHPRVADVFINLGAIQYERGHYPEAEKYDRQALDIVQAWYGKDNPETATDLTILARALVFQNRFDEAVDLLSRSLAIKEHAFGPVHPSVASTLNELGNVSSKRGKYDAAEQYFRRMADIYRQIYPQGHYLVALALSNIGSTYLGRQDWPRAETFFREAIPIYTEKQGPSHTNVGIARIKLGRALVRQHHYAEAELESRTGYEILMKAGMNPTVSWLVSVRQDLMEEYDALKRPDEAAKFRTEQTKIESAATPKK